MEFNLSEEEGKSFKGVSDNEKVLCSLDWKLMAEVAEGQVN